MGEKSPAPPPAGGVPGDANASPRRRFRATPREGRDVAEEVAKRRPGTTARWTRRLSGCANPERELRLDNPENRGEPQRRDRAGQPKRRRFGVARRPREGHIGAFAWRNAASPRRGLVAFVVHPSDEEHTQVGSEEFCRVKLRSFDRVSRRYTARSHRASRAYEAFCLCPRGIRHQVRLRPSIPPSVRLGLSPTSIPRRDGAHVRDSHHGRHKKPDRRETTVGGGDTAPNARGLHSSATASGVTVRA